MSITAFDDQYLAAPDPVREPMIREAILRRNIADMEVALRAQTELKERAEAEVSQLQRWKEEQLWIWGDVDAYARKRTPLGKSVCETALDLMSRAESAEAELAKLREQNPVGYIDRDTLNCLHDEEWQSLRGVPANLWTVDAPPSRAIIPLYAAPVHAPHKGATHCDDCGLTWLDDGLNPLWCPYCKDAVPAPAVPAEWREVMEELVADLQAACDAEHPHRYQYPSIMRKYKNDMDIVEKARALLQSAEVTNAAADRLLEGGE